MMQLYRSLSKIILALLSLSLISCGQTRPDIHIDDILIGGYKGPAGGPGNACTEVHTLHTELPPEHYGLSECLKRLVGKVYLDGLELNKMQANIDAMCTALGSCTYEQAKAISEIKQALQRGMELVR